jgi:hypothetical protein
MLSQFCIWFEDILIFNGPVPILSDFAACSMDIGNDGMRYSVWGVVTMKQGQA